MTEHKGFILYMDNKPFFTEVELEDAGRLICGIFEYKETGIPPDFSDYPFLKAAFIAIKGALDRDDEKYQKRCEKNRENALKRWGTDDANACDRIQSEQTHAKDADIDTGKGIGTGTDTGTDTGKGIGTGTVPSWEEVKAYAGEMGYAYADAKNFFEYYAKRNWETNGVPVRDWKALMQHWMKNELKPKKPKKTGFTNFEISPERMNVYRELDAML